MSSRPLAQTMPELPAFRRCENGPWGWLRECGITRGDLPSNNLKRRCAAPIFRRWNCGRRSPNRLALTGLPKVIRHHSCQLQLSKKQA